MKDYELKWFSAYFQEVLEKIDNIKHKIMNDSKKLELLINGIELALKTWKDGIINDTYLIRFIENLVEGIKNDTN